MSWGTEKTLEAQKTMKYSTAKFSGHGCIDTGWLGQNILARIILICNQNITYKRLCQQINWEKPSNMGSFFF